MHIVAKLMLLQPPVAGRLGGVRTGSQVGSSRRARRTKPAKRLVANRAELSALAPPVQAHRAQRPGRRFPAPLARAPQPRYP